MNKNILISIVIILAVIIVVLTGILIFINKIPKESPPVIGGNSGLVIVSLGGSRAPNKEISSPLEIIGYITGKDNWVAFEAQAGTVQLLDENNNVLGTAILTVTDENWMKEFNNFKGELNFVSPEDQNGKLVFHNENPSGLPDKNKEFFMPVKIKKTSGETMTIKAYFYNNKMDPDPMGSCSVVFSVEREISKTEGVAKAALEELLKGPTIEEKDKGYITNIPLGSRLNSIVIVNGEARVDFNEATESGGGSCSMAARVAQINETLLQFPTITSIKLSIDGRTEDILQP